MNFDWDENPDLNITPLVDIMLVLLAILMVSTPAIVYEELIKLPDGSRSKVIQKLPDIEVRIDAKRAIHIKQKKFKFNSFPDSFMLYSGSLNKKSIVYIKADERLKYRDVMWVLKSIKNAGFNKVSLETDG